jgi:hypothetical protein
MQTFNAIGFDPEKPRISMDDGFSKTGFGKSYYPLNERTGMVWIVATPKEIRSLRDLGYEVKVKAIVSRPRLVSVSITTPKA